MINAHSCQIKKIYINKAVIEHYSYTNLSSGYKLPLVTRLQPPVKKTFGFTNLFPNTSTVTTLSRALINTNE